MAYKWDEMTARERDALVAEKVMGLKVVDRAPNASPLYDNGLRLKEMRYTAYISAAWEVVEKMGSRFTIDMCVTQRHLKRFCCAFRSYGDEGEFVYADSMPEAICKAALRAVDVDIE